MIGRKDFRTMSSLKDLRLQPASKVGSQPKEQRQKQKISRGLKKNAALKMLNEDHQIYQKFSRLEKKNTKEDVAFIIKCLNKHFIFCSLMDDIHTIQYLIDHLFYCQVKQGQLIITQSNNASSFFILHTGKISVLINDVVKKQLKPGEGFGQLALLYNSQRSASCRAQQRCTLWGIDRTTFRKVVQQINNKNYSQNRKFINEVKFFDSLSQNQKDDIANIVIRERFKRNEVIVHQGDSASSFYIIKSGEVKVTLGGVEKGRLKEGDYFGENGLMAQGQARAMTVTADKQTILLGLGRDSVIKVLGSNLQVIVFRNKIRNILIKSIHFSKLSKIHHQKIIDQLAVKMVQEGQTVCSPGDICRQKMFFILDGEVAKNGQKIDHRAIFFGQQSLTSEKAQLKYNFTVKVTKRSSIAVITFKTLNNIVKGSFEEAVSKVITADQIQSSLMSQVQKRRQKMQSVPISDFVALKKLGFGQFGSVYLVYSKQTKEFYALKCISKQQIVETKLERHLEQQKKVLQLINFPLMVQYFRSYKDDYFIYFLMEFIRGMELFDVIREIGLLHTSDSQFYIGSMILCIQYLHSKGIIYRDLKPENIMIDQKGYLKLIDMGTCKFMKGKGIPKTYTIIGTPHYMAPQVLAGKGYSFNVDLWSIGICLFQFFAGFVPFGEDAQDPYQIYQEIVKKNIVLPNYVTDKKAKLLMDQLLNKIPQARLGGSFAALKSHSWFSSFDWDDLLARKLKVPFVIPQTKKLNLATMQSHIKSAKAVLQEIKAQSGLKKPGSRKDLDPNWDKCY